MIGNTKSSGFAKDRFYVVDACIVSLYIHVKVITLEQFAIVPLSLLFHVDKRFCLDLSFEQVISNLHAVIVVGGKICLLDVHVPKKSPTTRSLANLWNHTIHALHDFFIFHVVIIEDLRFPTESNTYVSSFSDEVRVSLANLAEIYDCLGPAHLCQVSGLIILVGKHKSVFVDVHSHRRYKSGSFCSPAYVNAPIVNESWLDFSFLNKLKVLFTSHSDIWAV